MGKGSGVSRGMLIGGGAVTIVVILLVLAYTLGGGKPLTGVSFNEVKNAPLLKGVCPDSGKLTLRLNGIESIKDSNDNDVAIGSQNVGVYLKGQTSALDTIALNASGSAASTSGLEPDCGAPYHLIFPAAISTTYYNTRYPAVGLNTEDTCPGYPGEWCGSAYSATYPLVSDTIGSFTLTATNGTSGDWQASGMTLAPAGTDNSDMELRIKEAGGDVVHGPFVAAIAYNPTNVTKIEVTGATSGCGTLNGVTVACPSYGTVASYNNASTLFTYQKFYVVSGTASGLKANGKVEVGIRFVPGSVCNLYTAGTAADCDFVIKIIDLGSRPKNGDVVQEYANSDSGYADISATDVVFKVSGGK